MPRVPGKSIRTFNVPTHRLDSQQDLTRAVYCTFCSVRKKARYQELLDNEQKYEELSEMQELRKQRQECVRCFLSIRESMLRTCLVEPGPSFKSNNETSLDEPRVQGLVSPPHRVVTFFESNLPSRDGSRAHSPQDVAERSELLSELIDSDADFEFKAVGSTILDASSTGSDHVRRETPCPPK